MKTNRNQDPRCLARETGQAPPIPEDALELLTGVYVEAGLPDSLAERAADADLESLMVSNQA